MGIQGKRYVFALFTRSLGIYQLLFFESILLIYWAFWLYLLVLWSLYFMVLCLHLFCFLFSFTSWSFAEDNLLVLKLKSYGISWAIFKCNTLCLISYIELLWIDSSCLFVRKVYGDTSRFFSGRLVHTSNPRGRCSKTVFLDPACS